MGNMAVGIHPKGLNPGDFVLGYCPGYFPGGFYLGTVFGDYVQRDLVREDYVLVPTSICKNMTYIHADKCITFILSSLVNRGNTFCIFLYF